MEPKRLYRIEDGKMLCGVCGGVAEYLNLDPTVVRLIMAAITFFSAGAGIILYLVGAIIMPVKQ